VRLAIRTNDDAVVLMHYSGRVRLLPGKASIAMIAPVFETGDPRYPWINEVQAVVKGDLSPSGQDSTTKSTSSNKPRASATAASPCASAAVGAP
jgi:hypothetical protein